MSKQAVIYRMVTDKSTCPFGIKALHLLKQKGYQVEDNHLKDRQETDTFKKEHNVKTTPQIFIDKQRIGGYDNLRQHFGYKIKDKNKKTYTPIIALFTTTFLIAFALHWQILKIAISPQLLIWFVAISMAILAMLKLRDLESFTNQFLGYDLLAPKFLKYAYIYPFAEMLAGIGMLVDKLQIIAAPIAIFIGTIGAISVVKAVYIEKRDLKCACVGGNSNVPLGFISLTENLMMLGMGIWMCFSYIT